MSRCLTVDQFVATHTHKNVVDDGGGFSSFLVVIKKRSRFCALFEQHNTSIKSSCSFCIVGKSASWKSPVKPARTGC